MTAEVPLTIDYMGDQLNATPMLEIITDGPYVPLAASGLRELEAQWSDNERKDFQDSPDDAENTRSSEEYINDLEMEFHERALFAKSTRLL
nr:retrovirus-related Pol polyprotein from transposon TNT 1-94 [Tanacetum cinerariifolium]